jgi:uncharacterized protein YdbL (DUF1318 family)
MLKASNVYFYSMKLMKCLRCVVLCSVCCLGFLNSEFGLMAKPAAAGAQNPEMRALISSMQARLPVLMELKLGGLVGETNLGLVEARGVLERDQRRILSDENRDRLAHYKLIAEKLGVTVAAVQRKRAEQIRKKSPRGIWLESSSGVWYRD